MGDTELYDILGVTPDATTQEISKAYRKLALTCHPDRGGDQDLFDRISKARDVLLDPKSRDRYDASGRTTALSVEEEFLSFFGRNAKGGKDAKEERSKIPSQQSDRLGAGGGGLGGVMRQQQPQPKANPLYSPTREAFHGAASSAARSSSDGYDELAIGDRVTVVGITARPELNGKIGMLVGYSAEQARWQVRLEEDLTEKLLKGHNLLKLGAEPGVAAAGSLYGGYPTRGAAQQPKAAFPKATPATRQAGAVPSRSSTARPEEGQGIDDLALWDRVTVMGIIARPELNGQTGVLIGKEQDRWLVRMEEDGSEKMLRSKNLLPFPDLPQQQPQRQASKVASVATPMRQQGGPKAPAPNQRERLFAPKQPAPPPPAAPKADPAAERARKEELLREAKEKERAKAEEEKRQKAQREREAAEASAKAGKEQELLKQLENAAREGDPADVKAARQACKDAGIDKKEIARAYALGSMAGGSYEAPPPRINPSAIPTRQELPKPAPLEEAASSAAAASAAPAAESESQSAGEQPQAATDVAPPADAVITSVQGDALDGRWLQLDTGDYMATISGETLTWPDGPGTDLERPSDRMVACELFGERFCAELSAEGCLVWTDGDVWVREDLMP
eukprot:CAMPEP_0178406412 /NCGR_PEP_ID=MMETSP0689_2-20121128/18899_1 /TAXON_ID=160604 /ORGANISM="Amphidinium massartii, Strain CS-259" /LENGTH=622 /DNA_ID=CAMNT_0020027453 /DNA_START=46 /DNA_END=1915 /DNA_ORIENTATION=+